MADIVDKQTRSRMMAGIRAKDTKPEVTLRRALHAQGFRYRLNSRDLPGRPDLVLSRLGAVIFVHGCFWHRHKGCRFTTLPSTRSEFWQEKFNENIRRDARVHESLIDAGWRIATVWECALRQTAQVAATVELVDSWLQSTSGQLEIGEADI